MTEQPLILNQRLNKKTENPKPQTNMQTPNSQTWAQTPAICAGARQPMNRIEKLRHLHFAILLLALVLALVPFNLVKAQQAVNASRLFRPGYTILRNYYETWSGNIVPGDSGLGQIWDFSNPGISVAHDSLYFSQAATRSWGNALDGQTVSNRQNRDKAQNWWSNTGAGLFSTGANVVNSAGEYADVIVTPGKLFMPAVARYQDRITSNSVARTKFKVGHNLGGMPWVVDSIYRYTTEVQQMSFDAYGTLKTPLGDVSDVLRQRIQITTYDTADYLVNGNNWLPMVHTEVSTMWEYRFWSPSETYPLAIMRCLTRPDLVDELEIARTVLIGPTNLASKTNKQQLRVYPSLVQDRMKIQLPETEATSLHYTIQNSLGQVVSSGTVDHTHELALAHLSPGQYGILVQGNHGVYSSKFVKQ